MVSVINSCFHRTSTSPHTAYSVWLNAKPSRKSMCLVRTTKTGFLIHFSTRWQRVSCSQWTRIFFVSFHLHRDASLPVLTGLNVFQLQPGHYIGSAEALAALKLIQAFDHSPMAGLADFQRVDALFAAAGGRGDHSAGL